MKRVLLLMLVGACGPGVVVERPPALSDQPLTESVPIGPLGVRCGVIGTGGLWSVAAAPTGGLFALGYGDGHVELRSETGPALPNLQAHEHAITALTFSPDGTILATGSLEGETRLWRLSDGVRLQDLAGGSARIQMLAFSPDASSVAGVTAMGQCRMWQAKDGTTTWVQEGLPATALAFSADGQILIEALGSRTLFRETGAGEIQRVLTIPSVQISAISPDGQRLFGLNSIGSELDVLAVQVEVTAWRADDAVSLWSNVLEPTYDFPGRLVISVDGTRLAHVSQTTRNYPAIFVPILNANDGSSAGAVPRSREGTLLALSGDGTKLLEGLPDGTLDLYRVEKPDPDPRAEFQQPVSLVQGSRIYGEVTDIATSTDGHFTAIAFDVGVRVSRNDVEGPDLDLRGAVGPVALSADNILALNDGNLCLRSLPGGDEILRLPSERLRTIVFSSDGRTIMAGRSLWDLDRGRFLPPLPHAQAVGWDAAAVSPDGTLFATQGQETLSLWQMDDRALIATAITSGDDAEHLTPAPRTLAFSPDSSMLAISVSRKDSTRGFIIVLDAHTGTLITKQAGYAPSLAFSPDGSLLAAGGDGVRVWQVSQWTGYYSVRAGAIVAFTPTNDLLVGTESRNVEKWCNLRLTGPSVQ